MKRRYILTLILLLATLTLAAQSNYSPCYTNNMSKGDAAYKQGKYSEARTYYANAKQCAGGNPSAAQQKINACDAKIKAQREAAEAKQRAEAEATEAKKRAEQEAVEAKRRAEEEASEAKRKAEAEAAEAKRKAETVATEAKRETEAEARGEFEVNGIAFKMIYVQGGTFTMGCTSEQGGDCYSEEKPSHSVMLGDFWMGETEVTQALWKAVMGSNPSRFKGDNLPVENVNWNDCQEFIKRLNQLTGRKFRLPTEAEWEYAARGGTKSRGYKYSGSNTIGDVAWYTDNSDRSTHPVKGKQANELGLYDMSGNLREWCQDWYSKDYYSVSPSKNPQGPPSGSSRVLRGGSWNYRDGICRVSERNSNAPDYRFHDRGFRLVLIP